MKHTPIPILSKSAKILAAMGFLAALTATASQAAVIILEASESAMIYQYQNSGFPNATSLEVGPDTNNYIYRSLISFDLSSIPDNAVITSASLTLRTRANRSGTQEITISLHRITESWVNAEGNVSWTKRDASTNWSTPGGSYIATASSALTGTFAIANADNIFTGLEDDVQLWLDNPSQNFGWMLINSGEGSGLYTLKNFYGGYRPDEPASYPPTLTIEYEVVPEASSAALFLLGAGCLVFFRKRRRANN